MRRVFALSLFVLQHLALGSGRPQPAPPAPTAAARRGEGALLANTELSDLLFPVLDQLDVTSQNHKKKRILEIMPITQKGKNRKMPLLIVASEIPSRKHKKIFSEDGKYSLGKKQKNSYKNKSKIGNSDEIINILSDAGLHFSSENSHSDEEEDLHHKHSHEIIDETKKKKRTKQNVSQNSDEYSSKDYVESDEREIDNKHSSHKNELEKILNDLFKHLPHDEDEYHLNDSKESSEQYSSKSAKNTKSILPKVEHDNSKINSNQNSESYEIKEENQENNVEIHKVHKHNLENKHFDKSENALELTDTKETSRQKSEEVDLSDSNSENSVEMVNEDISNEVKGDEGDVSIESQKEIKTFLNTNIMSAEKSSEKLEIPNEMSIEEDNTSEFSKSGEREEASVSVSESHELIENENLSADPAEDESSVVDIKSRVAFSSSDKVEVNQSNQRDLADPNQEISDSLEGSSISSSLDNSFADTYEFTRDSLSEENSDARELTISGEVSPNIKIEKDAVDSSIQDSMEGLLAIVDDASHHRPPISAARYGNVFRNANKGNVKEMHKTYKLSFRFNK